MLIIKIIFRMKGMEEMKEQIINKLSEIEMVVRTHSHLITKEIKAAIIQEIWISQSIKVKGRRATLDKVTACHFNTCGSTGTSSSTATDRIW